MRAPFLLLTFAAAATADKCDRFKGGCSGCLDVTIMGVHCGWCLKSQSCMSMKMDYPSGKCMGDCVGGANYPSCKGSCPAPTPPTPPAPAPPAPVPPTPAPQFACVAGACVAATVGGISKDACAAQCPATPPAPSPPAPAPPAPVPPAGCSVPSAPGLHRNLSCAGLTMWLSIPEGCTEAKGCGLIIDVHGLSMNPDIQNNNSDMRQKGAAAGYAVLQPHGPCCDGGKLPCRAPGAGCDAPNTNWGTTQPPVDQNDAAVYTMVRAVMAAVAVDPKRVHMHGFSQGGDMAWRWLCKHADLLASIAPSSFTARDCFNDYGDATKVPTDSRIPVLYQHGYFDRVEASLRPADSAGPAGWGPGGCCFDPTADSAWDTVKNLTDAWGMDHAGDTGGDGYNRTRYVAQDGVAFETIFHRFVTPQIQGGHCLPGGEDVVQPNPMAPGQVAMWSCTQRCDEWVWLMDNATSPPILCNKAVDVAPTDFPYNWNNEVIKWFDSHPKSA